APATQAAPSGSRTQERDVPRESPLFRVFASVTWGLAAFMFFSLLGQWMGRPIFVQWNEPHEEDLFASEMGDKGRVRILVPKNPAKGQARPPCATGEVEINGGCWIGPIKGMDVPCAPKFYEHQNECYVPMAADPKQPVAIDGGTIGDGGNKSDGGYDGDGGRR
ncbi:MAG TPA: hypothetical protein VK447_00050, partial [Myxococcaceae bacterium]|nr:hypothetical protein [Myxococcaceae bacterium]